MRKNHSSKNKGKANVETYCGKAHGLGDLCSKSYHGENDLEFRRVLAKGMYGEG